MEHKRRRQSSTCSLPSVRELLDALHQRDGGASTTADGRRGSFRTHRPISLPPLPRNFPKTPTPPAEGESSDTKRYPTPVDKPWPTISRSAPRRPSPLGNLRPVSDAIATQQVDAPNTATSFESRTSSQPSPLTPSFVYFRPEGIRNDKSRHLPFASASEPTQSCKRKATEELLASPEIIAPPTVRWDRKTGRGTAPLKNEPRTTGPRSCTLCSLTKKKVRFNSYDALIVVRSNGWKASE
jgi:hypothetical protein